MGIYLLNIDERSTEGRMLRKKLQRNKLLRVMPIIDSPTKVVKEASINETALAKDWLSEEDNRWDELLK